MLQTPSIAGDNEDNVVLISGESNSANEWTKEQLKSLFDHFTNKNTTTNARLDVLDSRSQHIYTTAASISTSLKGLEEDLQAKIAIHGENLAELAGRADKAESDLDSLVSRAGYTEASVGRLESGTEALEVRSKTLETRLETVESHSQALEIRSEALEETDKLLKKETKAIREQIQLLEPRQETLEDTSRKLLEDADLLKSRTEQQAHQFKWAAWASGGAVLAMAVAIGSTSWMSLSTTEGMGSDVSGKLSELRTDVMGRIESIESNHSDIAEVRRNILLLQEQVDAGFTNSSVLKAQYGSLSNNVQNLDDRLLTVGEHVQDVGSQLRGMDQQLEVIKERIYADDIPLPGTAIDLGLLHDASWLQAQNPHHYVIQLVNVYRKQHLADFVARHRGSLTIDQLSYFKTLHRGRDMYVLLYGNFPKFDQAMSEMEALPTVIQRNRPFLRSIQGVNDTMM